MPELAVWPTNEVGGRAMGPEIRLLGGMSRWAYFAMALGYGLGIAGVFVLITMAKNPTDPIAIKAVCIGLVLLTSLLALTGLLIAVKSALAMRTLGFRIGGLQVAQEAPVDRLARRRNAVSFWLGVVTVATGCACVVLLVGDEFVRGVLAEM